MGNGQVTADAGAATASAGATGASGRATDAGAVGNGAAAAGGANASGAQAPWFSTFSDTDLRGWTENKGWKGPEDAVKSARESEKLLGVPKEELIRMPKADAKPEEWTAFHTRMGVPAKPEDYKLAVPEGDNGEFAKTAAGWFQEAGITPRQAKILNEKWNAGMAAMTEAADAEASTKSQADILNLKREWGSSYDQRVELGRRAVRQFGAKLGMKPEESQGFLRTLENQLGSSAAFLRLFAAVGEGLGEHSFERGTDNGSGFGMTPAGAKSKHDELMADPEFRAQYMKGGKDNPNVAKIDNLIRIMTSTQG